MSYILEALRKSENERKQGEIPDLGSSVQIIHKNHKSGPSLVALIVTLALLVNAGVLLWLFWPFGESEAVQPVTVGSGDLVEQRADSAAQPEPVVDLGPVATPEPVDSRPTTAAPAPAVSVPTSVAEPVVVKDVIRPSANLPRRLPPSSASAPASEPEPAATSTAASEVTTNENPVVAEPEFSVPGLGDMPRGFQQRVPDLTFNSHIFSSDADSRRVMINNNYLSEGDRFQGMVVEEITEDGVILSLDGQSFAVSVVRNWNSPG